MSSSISILVSCLLIIFPAICLADGKYDIGKDGGGIFFQTDNDGGWYIDKNDLKSFKLGQSGTYSIEKDRNGTFIKTDTGRIFYLDIKAKANKEIEKANVNQEYERKMEKMRQKEAIKNAEQERLKAQERKAQADREQYQKMEEQKLEAMERMNQESIKGKIEAAKKTRPPVVNVHPIVPPPIVIINR